jgi:hypothetical protein
LISLPDLITSGIQKWRARGREGERKMKEGTRRKEGRKEGRNERTNEDYVRTEG